MYPFDKQHAKRHELGRHSEAAAIPINETTQSYSPLIALRNARKTAVSQYRFMILRPHPVV